MMSLVIPCLVAGVGVFVVSALIWILVRWHDRDIQQLPDEQSFVDAMNVQGLCPGLYMWPHHGGDKQVLQSPGFQERWKKGPWGAITIWPRSPNYLRNLIGSLLINIAVAFGVGMSVGLVLGGVQLGAGVLVSCTACQILLPTFILGCMAYCFGGLGTDLFLGKPSRFIGTSLLDGIIYAGVQAGLLFLLWPGLE